MMIRIISLLVLATTGAHAGASFDCRKAATPVERAICANHTLADLDGAIAGAYTAARQKLSASPERQAMLMSSQKAFVAARNKAFGQPGFDLELFLAQRLGMLQQAAEAGNGTEPLDIVSYFKLVPLAVFDSTTDGLEDEAQRALLLKNGESDDWTFRRVTASKAILRARHGNSIVTMHLMDFGQITFEVHVQNEKAETITYWVSGIAGKPLAPFRPGLLQRSAAAALHSAGRGAGDAPTAPLDPVSYLPAPIVTHVVAREACAKPGSRTVAVAANEPARSGAKSRCDQLGTIENELRRLHATDPLALAALEKAEALIKHEAAR